LKRFSTRIIRRSLLSSLFLVLASLPASKPAAAQFPPAPGTGPGLAETIETIDSARVTTRILYITAHPDDESAAVLTYLARGLHADVALLSLTRGEGGQNVLGPEQAPQLGLIRTQELLAATRGYGVKLYFTRAKDFGYSKTPEETMKVWGDQVLEDMVRVIRSFRPNIVINGWGGVHSGHGHHQAAGLLTPKAVALAADKSFCTDCRYDWKVEQILDLERGSEKPTGNVLPLDEVSPLWGKSWRELGIDAFVNHRTQGISAFINSPFLRRPIALKREDGTNFDPRSLNWNLLEILGPGGCEKQPKLCEQLKHADGKLLEARRATLELEWAKAMDALGQAQTLVKHLVPPSDVMGTPESEILKAAEFTQLKIIKALLLAAGFQISAESEHVNTVFGEPLNFTFRSRCRDGIGCAFEGSLISLTGLRFGNIEGDTQKGVTYSLTLSDQDLRTRLVGDPVDEIDSAAKVCAQVKFENHLDYSPGLCAPMVSIETSSVGANRVPLRVVPAYTLAVEPKQDIEVLAKQRKPFDVLLRVHSYSTQRSKVSVGLDVPQGWTSSAPVTAEFSGVGDQYVKLTVTPPAKLAAGNSTIAAYAKRGEEKFTTSLEPLPSMPTQLWEEPAQCVVHAFDFSVPENLHVGYITAESEPVPEALERLGIKVEMLDAAALAFSELSRFDAIVVGVRAYELRNELPGANQRLLDYVSGGGTLVVQYQRDSAWDKFQYAPYPAKIDGGKPGDPLPRITDENSPVSFLKPDDPLLNHPNKITQDDFKNWVQERGLYFWSDFDSKYTPLLAMNDPGEKELNGALVYAHFGKGTYIYTGLAFFRQLPEGVPGAYRLFVNLLSVSRLP
jgi:LmbE family N-acetylglucosaminyl deacetylase